MLFLIGGWGRLLSETAGSHESLPQLTVPLTTHKSASESPISSFPQLTDVEMDHGKHVLGITLRIICHQTSHFKAKVLEDQKGQHLTEIRSQLRPGPGRQPATVIYHVQLCSCLSGSLASHLYY